MGTILGRFILNKDGLAVLGIRPIVVFVVHASAHWQTQNECQAFTSIKSFIMKLETII